MGDAALDHPDQATGPYAFDDIVRQLPCAPERGNTCGQDIQYFLLDD